MRIVDLLAEQRASRRLNRAIRLLRARLIPVERISVASWEGLRRSLRGSPSAVPVVDPYLKDATGYERLVAVQTECASGLVIYGDFAGRSLANDILPLLDRCGIKRVITLDADDSPERIARELLHACGEDVVAGILRQSEDCLDWRQRMVVAWAIRNGENRPSVEAMAEALGASSRSIRRWFHRFDSISPGQLLSWGRLLTACRLVQVGQVDLSTAARLLEYATPSDLRRQYRDLTGRELTSGAVGDLLTHATRALVRKLGRIESEQLELETEGVQSLV